jgi:hypothetical protein
MLNKNLKKYKRNLEKQGNLQESNEYDFLPVTYLMPSEYVVFYEEFKKTTENEPNVWIMKPVSADRLHRQRSVKAKAYFYSPKPLRCLNGRTPRNKAKKSIRTSVKSILPNLYALEEENLT